jgi:hypothetical protein
MKNVFKQHIYQCKCGFITKEYVWTNDLEKTKVNCSNCSELLDISNLLNTNKNEAASIRTPTKNR